MKFDIAMYHNKIVHYLIEADSEEEARRIFEESSLSEEDAEWTHDEADYIGDIEQVQD